MILPDHEIRRHLATGDLEIDPLIDPDLQIQPASVDLRLGDEFNFPEIQSTTAPAVIDVEPGAFLLAHTHETVTIPPWLAARVEGRSSFGRLGLAVHVTAGFIDPGFHGQITLEIKNHSSKVVTLIPRIRICQIVFSRMTSSAETPYGDHRNHYQGQTGARPSALGDPDAD